MNKLTHTITRGMKSGLHVRVLRDGSWVLVADIDGTEHKVRRNQLALINQDIDEPTEPKKGDEDSALVLLDSDEVQVEDDVDSTEVEQVLAESHELTAAQVMSNAFKSRKEDYKVTGGNGDELQLLLRSMNPKDVCALADVLLNEPDGFHTEKYEHLNNGQRRMNSGNRIRALVKKGSVTMAEIEKASAQVGLS